MTAESLARAELTALVAELADARRRLTELAAEIAVTDTDADTPGDRPTMALLGVDLHSYYTIVESTIVRVIVALEGRTPASGLASHAELLREATRPLPGIRPALFAPDRKEGLDELRRFRHFFRHAYALDIQFSKLRRVLDPFEQLHQDIQNDKTNFCDFIQGLINELDGG